MNRIKALGLVFGVVVFLSAMSINSAKFNYYFVDPAHISGTDPRPPSPTISGMGSKGALNQPGQNGLSRYFNSLVAGGAYALAAF